METQLNKEQYELFENANRRIKQKKKLYNHLIIMIIGSLFLFVAYKWLNVFPQVDWFWWVLITWIFLFVLHFIRVFITEPFMGKKWEEKQMEKLVRLQQEKIAKMQADIESK